MKEKEIFWEVFGHFAKQGSAIRSLISFLIGGTVVLLLIVLAQHILAVAQLIFKCNLKIAHTTNTTSGLRAKLVSAKSRFGLMFLINALSLVRIALQKPAAGTEAIEQSK